MKDKDLRDLFSHNTPELCLATFPFIPEQSKAHDGRNVESREFHKLAQRFSLSDAHDSSSSATQNLLSFKNVD